MLGDSLKVASLLPFHDEVAKTFFKLEDIDTEAWLISGWIIRLVVAIQKTEISERNISSKLNKPLCILIEYWHICHYAWTHSEHLFWNNWCLLTFQSSTADKCTGRDNFQWDTAGYITSCMELPSCAELIVHHSLMWLALVMGGGNMPFFSAKSAKAFEFKWSRFINSLLCCMFDCNSYPLFTDNTLTPFFILTCKL